MKKDFTTAIKERRSIYAISKGSTIGDDKLQELINDAVKHTPSAFNSQSARAVVLLGASHDKVWNITREALRKIVPAENFAATDEKISSFQNGYGTVLFFEDQSVVKGLQEQFPLYQDNFPIWSTNSAGMLQLVVWVALENEGLGASLQHYNPLIDEEVKRQWSIPESWKLVAEMPFGTPTAPAGEKQFNPIEDRVKVFK